MSRCGLYCHISSRTGIYHVPLSWYQVLLVSGIFDHIPGNMIVYDMISYHPNVSYHMLLFVFERYSSSTTVSCSQAMTQHGQEGHLVLLYVPYATYRVAIRIQCTCKTACCTSLRTDRASLRHLVLDYTIDTW